VNLDEDKIDSRRWILESRVLLMNWKSSKLLVCNNLEVNNTINLLYKTLFMNWIFKRYFVSLSIIEFMNHSESKLHNIEYTLKSH
jgi:hypothetical protein